MLPIEHSEVLMHALDLISNLFWGFLKVEYLAFRSLKTYIDAALLPHHKFDILRWIRYENQGDYHKGIKTSNKVQN